MNSCSDTGKFLLFLCTGFLLSLLIFSCADSEPSVSDVRACVVFDFSDFENPPRQSFAVSIRTKADVRRAARLSVTLGDLAWTVTPPEIFENSAGQMVCFTNFIPPEGVSLKKGFLSVEYCDLSGRTAQGFANLDFPEEITSSTAENSVKLLQAQNSKPLQNLALYDGEGQLLYFGKMKDSWIDDTEILREFRSAVKKRTVYQSMNPNVFILLPEQKL